MTSVFRKLFSHLPGKQWSDSFFYSAVLSVGCWRKSGQQYIDKGYAAEPGAGTLPSFCREPAPSQQGETVPAQHQPASWVWLQRYLGVLFPWGPQCWGKRMGRGPGTLHLAACLCLKSLPEHQVLAGDAGTVAVWGFSFGLVWWKPKAQLGSCCLHGIGTVTARLCCSTQSCSAGLGRCFVRCCVAETEHWNFRQYLWMSVC